jgi:hypothetical protein
MKKVPILFLVFLSLLLIAIPVHLNTKSSADTVSNSVVSPPPLLGLLVFSYNKPGNFTTSSFPISNIGWQSMTLHVATTGNLQTYAPIVNVGSGDFEQVRFSCGGQQSCPVVTIPLPISGSNGISYKLNVSGLTDKTTAIGVLNFEPNSHGILLGTNLTLPYTSPTLSTSGYQTITVTAGQNAPQHINSISLQHFDGTNWVEDNHIACDGGAICPVIQESIPDPYSPNRVVIDGTGSGATAAYIVRPYFIGYTP